MRGLPPLPFEVLELELTISTNGSPVQIVQHFHCPGSIAWGYSDFNSFVSQWGTFAETNLLNVLPIASSFTTCRLSRYGITPFRYVTVLPANSGAHGEAQSLNSALCLTWQTVAEGYGSRSHNRLPLAADAVDDNKRQLHTDFWASYQLQAAQYILNVNGIVGVGGTPVEFVVVSRAQAGRPRPAAEFSPVVAGTPSLSVATLASRVRPAR